MPGVHSVALDMCRFRLQTKNDNLAMKPTLILTNIPEVAHVLNPRWHGLYKHQQLEGGSNARDAAVYTEPFVHAILNVFR